MRQLFLSAMILLNSNVTGMWFNDPTRTNHTITASDLLQQAVIQIVPMHHNHTDEQQSMPALKSLFLSDNQFRQTPALQDLISNQLSAIPESVLDISHNDIHNNNEIHNIVDLNREYMQSFFGMRGN